ncbi:MAG: tetratricopeptide repeat protein, partial [Planctomycetota bacterium]
SSGAEAPQTNAEALEAALWALQEFLILYPESAHVAEAYYALAHLYMSEGRPKMALDQLAVLCKEFPGSPWTVYGHYMAGRARFERGDWAGAERELLAVVDTAEEHVLTRSAFLWAAQAQVELGRYTEAVACFRRALADEAKDPLTPKILYNIAYCLEMSRSSPLEVEERYTELRTRFPETEYAREADYRLARMAMEAGHHRKAVARYEFYLGRWSIRERRGRAGRPAGTW